MTRLQQKLAGLITLGIVSAVSLLAGGIILGSASADDGNAGKDGRTVGNIPQFAPTGTEAGFNVKVSSHMDGDGQQSCVIAFGEGGDAAEAVPLNVKGLPPIEFKPADGSGPTEIKVFSTEGKPGEPMPFTQAVQARPLTEEDLAKLKTDGLLKELDPADCTIINPELMPEGWTPGKMLSGGIVGSGGASFNIVTTKP